MRQSAIALLLILTAAQSIHADDWPQWMGPKRDNVWRETGLLESFPEGGPRVVWRTPIAGGYAGPAVAGGKLYVTDYVTEDNVKVDNFDRNDIHRQRARAVPQRRDRQGNLAARISGEVHDLVPGRPALHAGRRRRQSVHARCRRQPHLLRCRHRQHPLAKESAEGVQHEDGAVGLRGPPAHRRR